MWGWRKRVPVERHRAQVGQMTIAYETAGAGPPLMLLHGLAGSARWWSRNVPVFAEQFHVHAVDLIGFGASRGGQAFVLSEAAHHLAAWLGQLERTRVSLVGHSMGGLIAADMAASYPELVERLVLVDAAALPLGRAYHRHALGLAGALRRGAPSFLPVLLADTYRAGPLTLLRAILQLLSADITARLGQIRAPTLLVWGQHDALVPLATGERLRDQLPGARLVVIPRAGHNPMWDRPEAFNRAVLPFLRGEEGAAPGPG